MPCVLDYNQVLQRLTAEGFRSLYHNSGAFGFAQAAEPRVKTLGWIGPDDATIRPAALPFVRRVAPPYSETLAHLSTQVWEKHLPGPVWVMPMNHWSFELEHGHRSWMPDLLRQVDVDPDMLARRNTGDALEFLPGEQDRYHLLVSGLSTRLQVSDFAIAFPGQPILCMLHHHQQLWWQTPSEELYGVLQAVPGTYPSPPNCA